LHASNNHFDFSKSKFVHQKYLIEANIAFALLEESLCKFSCSLVDAFFKVSEFTFRS